MIFLQSRTLVAGGSGHLHLIWQPPHEKDSKQLLGQAHLSKSYRKQLLKYRSSLYLPYLGMVDNIAREVPRESSRLLAHEYDRAGDPPVTGRNT